MNLQNSAIPLAQILTDLCYQYGLQHVVISPGSRNAPLIISFTAQAFFKTYSIVDERCAAFFALGIAQQLQQPTVLVCTSGSALLNYYPAIAEAYYSNIPLVVISADRPKHLIDVGDGQTIRQANVFSNHIAYQANLIIADNTQEEDKVQDYNTQEIVNAIQMAKQSMRPVHINAPFDEPLYQKTEEKYFDFNNKLFKENHIEDKVRKQDLAFFIERWNQSIKKLILVGVNHLRDINPNELQKIAEDDSVLVMTETTSNINNPTYIFSIDGILAPVELEEDPTSFFQQLQPDLVLSFGGMLVSKKLKAFLRNFPPKFHFHIHQTIAYDTFFAGVKHLQCTPAYFFKHIKGKISKVSSTYFTHWFAMHQKRVEYTEQYIKEIPYSDFWCYYHIFKQLPKDIVLHLGNSSCVRYSNLFELHKNIEVYCNRGTSGIDGSTSTAIGSAVVTKKPTYLIAGDLSFFYDSNALWNENIPRDFKIIIINNRGGGIFRILPGDKQAKYFHQFFETQHTLEASHLAKMFGFRYLKIASKENFEDVLQAFLAEKDKTILEICTPTEVNDAVLLDYFAYIK